MQAPVQHCWSVEHSVPSGKQVIVEPGGLQTLPSVGVLTQLCSQHCVGREQVVPSGRQMSFGRGAPPVEVVESPPAASA